MPDKCLKRLHCSLCARPACSARNSLEHELYDSYPSALSVLPLHLCCCSSVFLHPSILSHFSVSVGVKSAYSPATSTVYNQPPPPQRQVTALKPLAPSSSVSTSYNIYPVSTSVQQPLTPVSSYTLGSSFSSSVAATSYSGDVNIGL